MNYQGGVKAMNRYSRDEIETELKEARVEILELKASNKSLKIRLAPLILDTALSASLTSSMGSIHDLLQRGKGGSKAIAAMALEEET